MKISFNLKVEKDKKIIETRGFKKLCEIAEKIIIKTTLNYYADKLAYARFWFYDDIFSRPFYRLAIYIDGKKPNISRGKVTAMGIFISKVDVNKDSAALLCADDCLSVEFDIETIDESEQHIQSFHDYLAKNLELALINTDYII